LQYATAAWWRLVSATGERIVEFQRVVLVLLAATRVDLGFETDNALDGLIAEHVKNLNAVIQRH
jgi:hypothetical protein